MPPMPKHKPANMREVVRRTGISTSAVWAVFRVPVSNHFPFVVPPFSCSALLRLVLLSALAQAASAVGAVPWVESRPQHSFPRVGQYEVLACDFHLHTTFSDGTVSPGERVREAYRQGYDVIAFTDHSDTQAYQEAINLATALGIVLIRGFETGLAGSEHFVVLNAPAGYKPVDGHNWALMPGQPTVFYQEQLKTIARFGGLVIYAHPHMGYREPVLWGVKQGLIQGIEVKNVGVGAEWNTVKSHGTYCYPHAFTFALEHKLAILADSDAHFPRPANAAVAYVLAKNRSVAGVIEAIREARTFAWFDHQAWGNPRLLAEVFKAGVSITEAEAGDRYVRIKNNSPLSLRFSRTQSPPLKVDPYGEELAPVAADAAGQPWVVDNVWVDLTHQLALPVNTVEKFAPAPPTPANAAAIARELARELTQQPAVVAATTPPQFTAALRDALLTLSAERLRIKKIDPCHDDAKLRAWAGKIAPAFRIGKPPVIDGRLDEEYWQLAASSGEFTAYTSGLPVKTSTRFAVGYDDANLYLGVWCDQAREELAATAPKTREEWDRNSVEVLLGREADASPVWQLAFSRGGQVWDGYQNGKPGWKPQGLRCAGNVSARQWTVEAAIPWMELGLNPQSDQLTLLNVVRNRCPSATATTEVSSWFFSTGPHKHPIYRGYLLLK